MKKIKIYTLRVISIIVGVFFSLIIFELVFRILPSSTAQYRVPVNNLQPLARFQSKNIITTSHGWNMKNPTHKGTNNYGFFSDDDYHKDSSLPLIAVIGDSYVEATQVENNETFHGLLGGALEKKGRVYSFAMGGAPLSQYLAYANFAREEFSPESIVFNIIHNDFDQSLTEYENYPGFHYFVQQNGKLVLQRFDRKDYPFLFKMAMKSSLVMYLLKNLRIQYLLNNKLGISTHLFSALPANKELFSNPPKRLNQEMRLKDSYRVISKFFELLPEKTGLNPSKIQFVIDGIREVAYGKYFAPKESYFFKMREAFIRQATKLGYEVIDMNSIFREEYTIKHEKFEHEFDNHWNSLGHFLVAQEIGKSETFKNTFGKKILFSNKPKGQIY